MVQTLRITLDDKVIYWQELDVQNLPKEMSLSNNVKDFNFFRVKFNRFIAGSNDRGLRYSENTVS